jgi:hypothetical protein
LKSYRIAQSDFPIAFRRSNTKTQRRDQGNWGWLSRVCVVEPQREKQKMPLLFYFPLIVWMGMLEAMQDEMRVPATAKPRR